MAAIEWGSIAEMTATSVAGLVAALVIYADFLASLAIVRDRESTRLTRLFRLSFVWLVPVLGSMVALRAAAEESPALLPSRRWLWPVRPLLADQQRRGERARANGE